MKVNRHWEDFVRGGAACILAVLISILGGSARASEHLVTQPLNRESCNKDTTVLGAGALDQGAFETLSGVRARSERGRRRVALTSVTGVCPNPDDLNAYAIGTTGPYDRFDQTAKRALWHVLTAPCSSCPQPITGARSLWMGACDSTWAARVGYPNNTYQILYLDTGAHAADYTLHLQYNVSAESGYDFLYLIGGGGDAVDPAGCDGAMLDEVIFSGGSAGSPTLLASWTGSIRAATPSASSMDTRGSPAYCSGAADQPPENIDAQIIIASEHRALYFVFKSDERFSHEDGKWCQGKGALLDSLRTSDNGLIYSEEEAAGIVGPPPCNDEVIKGTSGAPIISARVPTPVGALWAIQAGSVFPTSDPCAPVKNASVERFFFGGDPVTQLTIPRQFNSVVACPVTVPPGTKTARIRWNEYMDLPRGNGFVRFAEFRLYRAGSWSRWTIASPSGGVNRGALQGWRTEIEALSDCERADQIQVRYTLQCTPSLTTDRAHCTPNLYGAFFDDFKIEFTSGAAAPAFGVFPGAVAQTTFVDGTILGSNCAGSLPCWPGVRGTALGVAGIDDNVNSALGDSMTLSIRVSGLSALSRINWHHAFDKCVDGGRTIAYTNPAFVAPLDCPRLIFRVFDPQTKTWSPFDSSELDVDGLSISAQCGGVATDSVLTDCTFRWDWPPRDKLGTSLPGGFTVNGIGAYSQLAFLPRGVRLQYYYKGVDVSGGRTYQFNSDQPALELLDLPTLPGGMALAPDIMEFDVLPNAYPAGAPTSLLATKTKATILNLDAAYTTWGYGVDPVTYALKGLGVRADRYRLLQGLEEGNNVGGSELAGFLPTRASNFFPNLNQYPIVDSLAAWYRIIIISSHVRHSTVLEEQDAKLLDEWWRTPTGSNGGDRCILATGDDFFNFLLNSPPPLSANQSFLAQDAFGVQSTVNAWSGTFTNMYPLISDTFVPLTYKLDGGCPNLSRFDALTKVASSDATNIAFYPGGTEVAGITNNTERDPAPDNDRNKALGYGFSIQYVRSPLGGSPSNIGPCAAYGGLSERLQILAKFLTSCRGPRTPLQIIQCLPCPGLLTSAALTGNWATDASFDTTTYGPLYPIQDYTAASAVEVEEPGPSTVPFINSIAQNRPNPFNPETVIPYSLSTDGRVTIRIFDVMGRLVRTLVDEPQKAGPHAARWNGIGDRGRPLAGGIYFYTIRYPDGTMSGRKMTILR